MPPEILSQEPGLKDTFDHIVRQLGSIGIAVSLDWNSIIAILPGQQRTQNALTMLLHKTPKRVSLLGIPGEKQDYGEFLIHQFQLLISLLVFGDNMSAISSSFNRRYPHDQEVKIVQKYVSSDLRTIQLRVDNHTTPPLLSFNGLPYPEPIIYVDQGTMKARCNGEYMDIVFREEMGWRPTA